MKSRCYLIPMLVWLAFQAPAQTATFELQIHDYAALKPLTLQAVAIRVHDILAESGLSIQTRICTAVECESTSTSARILVLRIVRRNPSKMYDIRWTPMGQSFVDKRGGTYASVFVEQVQQEAAEADVPWPTVLTYAAAHEVGHLLLGSAHSQRGLMKAYWDKRDFQAINQSYFHFSHEQIRQFTAYGALLSLGAPTDRDESNHR